MFTPDSNWKLVAEDMPQISSELKPIREKALNGQRLSREDGLILFQTADVLGVGALAQWSARRRHQRFARYVVNGHINYSNYCALACAFCSFFRRKNHDQRHGGYEMSVDEVVNRADIIAASGATEIHIVGALHPSFPLNYYTDILKSIRRRHPRIGLKCFSAIEIYHISALAQLSPIETLQALKEAGLDTLTGGGAEILDDTLRKKICPGKESSAAWLDLHRQAHRLGIRSNASLLFGHVENFNHRVEHLLKLRELQDETGGFLAFVPLSYHPENNALNLEYGPSALDELRACAVSRLLLDNFSHIKAYWVALSPPLAQIALAYGASDFDGTVLQEKIYHAAGTQAPQSLTVADIQRLIREAGYEPIERDHLYRCIIRKTNNPLDWSIAIGQ